MQTHSKQFREGQNKFNQYPVNEIMFVEENASLPGWSCGRCPRGFSHFPNNSRAIFQPLNDRRNKKECYCFKVRGSYI